MSKKRTTYSPAFKTKLVLELLQNADTLAEIASKHNILPQSLVNWKKTFLANAKIAMEPSKAKEELIKSQEQNEHFWRSAKVERIYLNAYQSIGELTTDVDNYIEFYNHRRFHETLDYKKPMDVYQESIKLNQNKKKAS
jgi:transposase-like protein